MDSIPQELIDAIIDNVPHSSLPSCSLVAKRWRRTSQRRILSTISLSSKGEVDRWCTDIPPDSDGISSYVRHVKVKFIFYWAGPALFNRLLGTLSSLTKLSMYTIEITDELLVHIPDLKELCVRECNFMSGELHPTYSVTPQRRPLDSLEVFGCVGGIGRALAKSQFVSSRLFLDADIIGVEQLLMISSEAVVELKLHGV
jgi:hypothetical protein